MFLQPLRVLPHILSLYFLAGFFYFIFWLFFQGQFLLHPRGRFISEKFHTMGSLIAHGSIYQRNIDEKTSLPSSPTPPLCSPPLCFPLLVWIYLTVLFQLSLQQQMSAILELNWELSLLNWAQGYLTCLTRCLTAEFFQVSQSSFCSWSKRGSSTVVFTDIFHII